MEETNENSRTRRGVRGRRCTSDLAGDARVTARRRDLIVFVCAAVFLAWYSHHLDSSQTHRNCLAIENLKGGQRANAQATIDGDLAFLKAHPGGTVDFPEAVVNADIEAKQKIVDRYPERKC